MAYLIPQPWIFDVEQAAEEIEAHPEIWNQYSLRTEGYGPHSNISDIWVRYNAWDNYLGDRATFNAEHESSWYPCVEKIPSVKKIVFDLMRKVEATRLGGVLITKIPAGGEVKPHTDGGWHATYYGKYAVQLKSTPEQAFHFEGESFSALPGECYSFDNSQVHWVTNPSKEDRMTLIICVRK